ncbi:helix-turn-helix transcriptional regulator [Lactiplantibacillus plantarum subsp. plantarum]|uniref:helix-turn-helix domain-containing protein n=1 Tax=Lactiplantibacillus plantarum TaxID=1590 RepID=UPI0010FBFFE3|nr:helix-turn-helix transcriptional regulator [Lactiplantibacillus plantarum]QCS76856.1 helix-turn-helix transcriptional regulator [Lactiplantibacillus plantarum subsp. plantarum]
MTMFDRVKEISKKRGLTLAQLNEKVGFKQNVIYSWKTKTPSVDKVKAVADVLNVSVDYLLGNTDNPEPSASSDNLTKNQKLIAYSIDPDISDEERQAIINMVKEAMKFRRRL